MTNLQKVAIINLFDGLGYVVFQISDTLVSTSQALNITVTEKENVVLQLTDKNLITNAKKATLLQAIDSLGYQVQQMNESTMLNSSTINSSTINSNTLNFVLMEKIATNI